MIPLIDLFFLPLGNVIELETFEGAVHFLARLEYKRQRLGRHGVLDGESGKGALFEPTARSGND